MPARRKLAAYTAPMLAFIALLALNGWLKRIDNQLWLTLAEYWIYPTQAILCGALLIWFHREYPPSRGYGAAGDFLSRRGAIFCAVIAVVTFLIWISPQAFLGFAPRTAGFNPLLVFNSQSPIYWLELIFRFARLVVVVPFIEEIFWRGFLLRFLINENFERVPIGAFSWLSFSIVTLGFALSHSPPDWPAAVVTGALYNGVAYRTKSLSSCILTHAVTNLLLGLWIVNTKQWGFW
jgi:CAAX prenyl protease-like protein